MNNNQMKDLQERVHETAKKNGWWEQKLHPAVYIALIHSELSEALEWLRKTTIDSNNNLVDVPPSDHGLDLNGLEEEMADVVIRVMDFCEAFNIDLSKAIYQKMNYNEKRSYKHGGKSF